MALRRAGGDLSALGLPGGANAPDAGESAASGLDTALSKRDAEKLMSGLEQGLRRHATWLRGDAGLDLAERRWPVLLLSSARAGLRLLWYGLNHGHPPPALSLALVDPVGGELPAYELDALLDTGGGLDAPLRAEDPDWAARALEQRLNVLRPLLAGEEEAWRSLPAPAGGARCQPGARGRAA